MITKECALQNLCVILNSHYLLKICWLIY